LVDPEDEDSMFLLNFSSLSKDYTELYPRSQKSYYVNDLKQGDALLPFLFNFALEYISKVQENQVGLKFNGTHQFIVYAN
jgi:hypothetical protein